MKSLDYKRIGLIVAVVATSAATWAVARIWLDDPARFSSIIVLIGPAMAFIISTAVTAVAFLLMEHRWDRIAAILASWAVFVFFWAPNIWYISLLPVFAGLWWMAAKDIRESLEDRRRLRISASLRQGAKLILLGFYLMVSLGFYLLPSSQRLNATTVSRDVQHSIESSYDNMFVQQQLAQLPPAARAQFQRDVSQYVYQTARTWLSPLGAFIPPLLAFGLFLALWSVNSILRPPAVWIGDRLFRLLKRVGFVNVTEQDVKGETIIL
jgi:hypothetical protein